MGAKSDELDNKVTTANAELDSQGRQAATNLATQGATARTQISTREDLTGMQRQATESTKTVQINNAAEQKLKELASDRRVTSADLFQSFDHSNQELEQRKDAAELEQLGFLLAMRDKSYLDELERVGQERGLQDEMAFREESTRLAFGNSTSDLLSKLGFQSAFNSDEREFEKQLSGIDAEGALAIATSAIKDANNQAVVQGGIQTAKAGADYWAESEKEEKKTTNG